MARTNASAPRLFRELIKAAIAVGWVLRDTRGGHLKLVPPDGGGPVFMSRSPSDKRARLALRATLRQRGLDL